MEDLHEHVIVDRCEHCNSDTHVSQKCPNVHWECALCGSPWSLKRTHCPRCAHLVKVVSGSKEGV